MTVLQRSIALGQWHKQKVSEGGPKFRRKRVMSQTSFGFALHFLGLRGGTWYSGPPSSVR